MMRKGGNKRKASQSEKCSFELDYDRLAESIVAAMEKSKTTKPSKTASRELMKCILMPILYCVAIFCALIAVGSFVVALKNATTNNLNSFFQISVALVMGLFMALISAFVFMAAKEVGEENDRDYVASLFSNVVSFAALVIALVALLKEIL